MIQAQPYRKGARQPGPALDAMKRGTAFGEQRATPSSGGGRRAFRQPRKLRQPRAYR